MVVLLMAWGCASSALDAVDPALFEATPTWTADIQPLLDRYCVSCHDGDSTFDGGLELATYEAARGTRIPDACTASSPEVIAAFADVLVLPTEYGDGQPCPYWEPLSMPPHAGAHLSTAEQVVLMRWIETGAPR